ncbi:hypothetical protein PybrP1_009516 [[Pythium] brassicae (nom. inval.)]|nr:hypothetical protein PybrP1_009516 [[Pythium] brassicae (nom. inval.)]
MATVTLIPRHIFGVKADVAGNAVYVDDQAIAYPAGHNMVIYSLDEKRQKFIAGTENTEGITAVAIAPSRRFLAVAEKSDRGLVSIYDLKTLKKRKVLSSVETQGRAFVNMEFSADNQLLLTQGGAPDWILTCWNWAKGKAVASIKSPVHVALHPAPSLAMLGGGGGHFAGGVSSASMLAASSANLLALSGGGASGSVGHGGPAGLGDAGAGAAAGVAHAAPLVSSCSFSNVDPGLICVVGAGLVRYFRVLESAFRPMPSPRVDAHVLLCHAWLKQRDDYMLAGSAAGDLLLFHGGEFAARQAASPGDAARAVHALVATSKGVLCGLADASVYLYALASEAAASADRNAAELLVLQRRVRVDAHPGHVVTLCVSPSEDAVVAALSSGQLLTFPYQHHVGGALSASTSATLAAGDEPASAGAARSEDVEFVLSAFHRPSDGGLLHVTGMDVCVRKPILVTCGLDRSVRVWNYLERTCEVAKQFAEEAHSVACHPSGLYLLVGFADKLRLLNVLMDDIRPVKEFAVKACRECQFSSGGHLFAAVNGNTIQVFSLFSSDLVANLRGHNGKVRSLFWNADDSGLVSAGMDGAVYQWELDEAKREAEFVQKGVPYFSALCNREGTALFAAGGDRLLKEIELPSSQLAKEFVCDRVLGQLALAGSQRVLFGATAEPERPGAVRAFKFPLTGESVEVQCLSAPATRLRLSVDDAFLFAAGEDGAVCVFEIRDKEGRPRAKAAGAGGGASGSGGSEFHHAGHFSEEILVTKSDLEEKNALMAELKNKVDELMLHNEYQLRLKDMTYNESLKDLTEKFTHEIELEKNKFELLREDKNDLEMAFEDKLKALEERHLQRLQEAEAAFQHRIMTEVERYQDVLAQREAQSARWRSEQARLVSTHARYVADVAEDFAQRLSEDRQLRVQLEDETDELTREYAETVAQVEADVDDEVAGARRRYEDKLQAEREATLRFKGENGIMKKKFAALQKAIEEQRDEIKGLLEKEKALVEAAKALEREIQALKREIRARDETIGEKEKRIYDLKKKNQELEKFKFVLDFKIKELKRQIEPRENEIADMKAQIKAMDRELELFHKSNAQLDLLIGEQRARIDAMQREAAAHRRALSDQRTWVRRFRCALYECVQHVQSPAALARHVAALYSAFVPPDGVPAADVEADIRLEYARQRAYLDKSVLVLKHKHARDAAQHQEATVRATADNMALIREINELRSALGAAKATLQMEKAAAGGRHPSPLALERDPDALLDQQRREIDELRRAVGALEEKMAAAKASEVFPPIRGLDG